MSSLSRFLRGDDGTPMANASIIMKMALLNLLGYRKKKYQALPQVPMVAFLFRLTFHFNV